jgi:hypothetical protein
MAPISLAETVVILQIDLDRLGIARRHIRARGIEWEILDARTLWGAMVTALGQPRASTVGAAMGARPEHLKIHTLLGALEPQEMTALAAQLGAIPPPKRQP